MKHIKYYVFALALLVAPALASAQSAQFGALGDFASTIVSFINGVLIPLIFAVALLVFIWGMFTYFILGGADEGKRDQGKSLMTWAIIGFVMMIIIWGIVNLLAGGLMSGLGTDNTKIEQLPQAQPI